MIRLLIIIAVLFLVMAISPVLIGEKGYILIAVGETTIESTVLSAAIMLSLLFLVLFITFKLLRGSLNISFSAWRKVAFAGQKRGIINFNKALAAYMLEDYNQAEQLFSKSAVPSKRKHSAYLMAASASAKMQLNDNTNHYLALLEKEGGKVKELGLDSVVVKMKLLMNQDNDEAYQQARQLLDEHHKYVGHDARLLALAIDLCLIEQSYQQAIDFIASARKEKSINTTTMQAWEKHAYSGLFNELITQQNQASLEDYWKTIARKLKQHDTVFFAYCSTLAEHNLTEPLNKLLIPMLKKNPSADFLKQLRALPIKQAEPLIAIAQKQLHNDIHSAKWLSCLGHLAVNSSQWSMAEKAFGSLTKLEKPQHDQQDLQALAVALTHDGLHQEANAIWLQLHQDKQVSVLD